MQELVFLTLKLKYLYSSTPDLDYTQYLKDQSFQAANIFI